MKEKTGTIPKTGLLRRDKDNEQTGCPISRAHLARELGFLWSGHSCPLPLTLLVWSGRPHTLPLTFSRKSANASQKDGKAHDFRGC
jgi:hypothetical protein